MDDMSDAARAAAARVNCFNNVVTCFSRWTESMTQSGALGAVDRACGGLFDETLQWSFQLHRFE